jgi:activator of 2-hydroxyglutaryl-CoA dehydratase
VIKALEEALQAKIYIAENPQVRGAIGAAHIGQRAAQQESTSKVACNSA